MSLQTQIGKQIPVEKVTEELDAILSGILIPKPQNRVAEFTKDWKTFTSRLGGGILRKIS